MKYLNVIALVICSWSVATFAEVNDDFFSGNEKCRCSDLDDDVNKKVTANILNIDGNDASILINSNRAKVDDFILKLFDAYYLNEYADKKNQIRNSLESILKSFIAKNRNSNYNTGDWKSMRYDCLKKIYDKFVKKLKFIYPSWVRNILVPNKVKYEISDFNSVKKSNAQNIKINELKRENTELKDSILEIKTINRSCDSIYRIYEAYKELSLMKLQIDSFKILLLSSSKVYGQQYPAFLRLLLDSFTSSLSIINKVSFVSCDELRSYINKTIEDLKNINYKIDYKIDLNINKTLIYCDTILFEESEIEVNDFDTIKVSRIINILKDNIGYEVILQGYASKTGGWADNWAISNARCYNVKKIFLNQGIDKPMLIEPWGKAEKESFRAVVIKIYKIE